MAVPNTTASSRLTVPVVAAIGALGVAVLVGGGVNWARAWGPSLTVAGGLIAGAALVGWWMRSWIIGVLAAIAATGLGMALVGIGVRADEPAWAAALLVGGVAAVLLAAAAGALAHMLLRMTDGGFSPRVPRPAPLPVQQVPNPGTDQLARLEQLAHDLLDLISVSDAARRELFPMRDLEVIHNRLEQALAMGDFTAAERAIAVAESLGHEGILPALRSRISEAQRAIEHAQAAAPLQAFEGALSRRDWADAFQHAAQVRAISPNPATAAHLEERVQAARQEHKQALERQFLEAGERDDVETAMATLKELDRYMTREEAERLSREAQRVIQRHRERLTATFQAAVQEKRWSDAARVGNAIIAEYPNTRMAEEVRTMIEVIRTRATQTSLAREEAY